MTTAPLRSRRLEVPAAFDAIQDYYEAQGWTTRATSRACWRCEQAPHVGRAMRMRIGVLGAGGVGGYTGGYLSLAGEDVRLIGQRQENVAHIRSQGLRLVEAHGERVARPVIWHVSEVQQLTGRPLDAVLLCVKSYDTTRASALIAPFLAPDGCIASMRNGLNEDPIAAVVGWERTIGVVMSSIGVNAVGLGQVMRTSTPGGDAYTVFRVGRPDG